MEIFHFSTFLMAILTSTLLLMILSLIFCHKKILLNAGYKLIAVFLILNVVRLFLPIEFPFATTVPLPQGISKVIIAFFAHRFFTDTWKLSFYKISILIWIVGILFKTYRFIRTNRMIKKFIFTYGKDVTSTAPYKTAMKNVCMKESCPFHIYEVPDITSPLLFGIRRPYLLIPADQGYDQQTLIYILRHEAAHYKHHDLLLKLGVQLLSIIYWWNPFSYLLRKQINLVIEMRVDDTITDASEREAHDYLQCLIHIADSCDSILNHKLGNVISFLSGNETELSRRFVMLIERKRKKKKGIHLSLLCLISSIFICSYLFIFEAYYFVPEINDIGFRTNELNSFAVDNEDGTYSIYLLNTCIESTASLDYYGEEFPVLTKEEFQHVQESLFEQN